MTKLIYMDHAATTPVRPEKLNKLLLRHGIVGGLPLHGHLRQLEDHMLVCTTELHSDQDYDRLIAALKEFFGMTGGFQVRFDSTILPAQRLATSQCGAPQNPGRSGIR
jgi:hypothetical protein